MSNVGGRGGPAPATARGGAGSTDGHAAPGADAPVSLIDLLHRTTQVMTQRFTTSIGDYGPTPRQLAVLNSIGASDGLSQTEISDATGIDRATTAEIVGRLNRLGWIKRRRTRHDARTYAVSLTEDGRSILAKARATSQAIEADILALLPADERDRLMSLLTVLSQAGTERP